MPRTLPLRPTNFPDWMDRCGECGSMFMRSEMVRNAEMNLRCQECYEADGMTALELGEYEAKLLGTLPVPYQRREREMP